MAKSQRASSRKRNNAALRSKLFGPAADARTERLSAKLQELASSSKPTKPAGAGEMEVDSAVTSNKDDDTSTEKPSVTEPTTLTAASNDATGAGEMDVDGAAVKTKSSKGNKTGKKAIRLSKGSNGRITKVKKARNNMIFPDLQARKRRQQEAKARRAR